MSYVLLIFTNSSTLYWRSAQPLWKEPCSSVVELQKCQIRIGLVLVAKPLGKELFKRQN